MNIDDDVLKQSEKQNQVATHVIKLLDKIAENQNESQFQYENINLALVVTTLQKNTFRVHVSNKNFTLVVDDGDKLIERSSASILLPKSITKIFNRNVKVYSYSFRNSKLFVSHDNKTTVRSNILSLTVVNQSLSNLPEPIELTFVPNDKLSDASCGFWQKSKGIYSF